MNKQIKALTGYEITCKDGMYFYYIYRDGERVLLMTYSKDLAKEQ